MSVYDEDWWKDKSTVVLGLSNDVVSGVTSIHTHETPDGWEYAVVRWIHDTPRITHYFKNGELLGFSS